MPPEELVRKRVKDPGDFEWLKQCRFYWRDDKDTVIISICDRSFEYSFEYLGWPKTSSPWVRWIIGGHQEMQLYEGAP